jgi:hypothetical protein
VRLLKLCSILILPTIFSNVLCYNPRSVFSGHNFGAYHTHDAGAWNPLIDSCGLKNCNGLTLGAGAASVRLSCLKVCTALPKSTHILTFNSILNTFRRHILYLDYVILPFMYWRRYVLRSVVDCSRSWYIVLIPPLGLFTSTVSNIAPSFGGYWNEGDRNNIDNWRNDPDLSTFGTDPKRVAKVSPLSLCSCAFYCSLSSTLLNLWFLVYDRACGSSFPQEEHVLLPTVQCRM